MAKVSISKKEYEKLLGKALRLDYLHQIIEEDLFSSPPTRSIKEIIKAFKETELYSQDFLKSLEKGLRCSSYFNN